MGNNFWGTFFLQNFVTCNRSISRQHACVCVCKRQMDCVCVCVRVCICVGRERGRDKERGEEEFSIFCKWFGSISYNNNNNSNTSTTTSSPTALAWHKQRTLVWKNEVHTVTLKRVQKFENHFYVRPTDFAIDKMSDVSMGLLLLTSNRSLLQASCNHKIFLTIVTNYEIHGI